MLVVDMQDSLSDMMLVVDTNMLHASCIRLLRLLCHPSRLQACPSHMVVHCIAAATVMLDGMYWSGWCQFCCASNQHSLPLCMHDASGQIVTLKGKTMGPKPSSLTHSVQPPSKKQC